MRARTLAALWVLGALWFVPGSLVTLEWLDEGHLVYFASRVAEGALPYRDFHHIYGPGMFLLNGALFRLFGEDLLVVRLALVGLKATLGVVIASLAGDAGGVLAGVLAWGLFVGVWGAPLWVFATPYASVYQVTLDLIALVVLLKLRPRPRLRGLVTGLCLGLAFTFKQTAGVFAGAGIVAFLISEGRERVAEGGGERDPVAMVIRLALLSVTFAAAEGYLGSFGEHRAWFILGTPLAMLLSWVGWRVVRAGAHERSDLVAIGWTTIGAAVAPAACVAYFATQGALRALIGDTLLGLPQTVTWRVPLQAFDRTAATAALLVGLGLGTVEVARRGLSLRGRLRVSWGAASAVALAVFVATAVFQRTWGLPQLGAWQAGVLALIFWLPVAVTWVAAARILCVPSASPGFVASTVLAAVLLPGLQPAGDLPHVLLALPVFVLPLAGLATQWVGRRLPAPGLAAAAVGVVAVALVGPFAEKALESVELLRTPGPTYERATAIRDPGSGAAEARALVEYLARTPEETRVAMVPGALMVQFLAGRRSGLEEEDFGLYLGTVGMVADATARRLVDQEAAIARLAGEPVLLVRRRDPATTATLHRVFPTLFEYFDTRFREVAVIGPYQVLAPMAPAGD